MVCIVGSVGVLLGFGPASAEQAAPPPVGAGDVVSLALLAACPVALAVLWWKDVIRPGSLSRRHARDVTGSPVFIWWIGALMLLVAQGLGGIVGMGLAEQRDRSWGLPAAALSAGLAQLAASAYLLWMLRETPWGSRAGLSLWPRARDAGAGVLGIVLVLPFMAAATAGAVWIATRMKGGEVDPIAHDTLRIIAAEPWSLKSWCLIAAAVVLVPIVEEVLFRGMVQSGVLRIVRRRWTSVIIASAIFAAAHVSSVGESKHALLPLFVFGVCLGAAYERTGRLWTPIVMHALFNGLNIALTLLAASAHSGAPATLGP